jgi:hypothetical protein
MVCPSGSFCITVTFHENILGYPRTTHGELKRHTFMRAGIFEMMTADSRTTSQHYQKRHSAPYSRKPSGQNIFIVLNSKPVRRGRRRLPTTLPTVLVGLGLFKVGLSRPRVGAGVAPGDSGGAAGDVLEAASLLAAPLVPVGAGPFYVYVGAHLGAAGLAVELSGTGVSGDTPWTEIWMLLG